MSPLGQTVDERFFSKVHMTSECWEWTGNDNRSGYGRFWYNGATVYPHRLAYEQVIGPIPAGLQIDHLCRNRACVRPEHLEPVTCRENLIRGNTSIARKVNQTHCIHGHPLSGDNLYIEPNNRRRCRECIRRRVRAYYARKKRLTNGNV